MITKQEIQKLVEESEKNIIKYITEGWFASVAVERSKIRKLKREIGKDYFTDKKRWWQIWK